MEDLPPQIEEAIEDYVDLSHGRTVTVLPIRQPEHKTEGDVLASRNETSETRTRRAVIGALIVEQIDRRRREELGAVLIVDNIYIYIPGRQELDAVLVVSSGVRPLEGDELVGICFSHGWKIT
jgi:F0F1-type ATP synthase beta subunit